MRDEGYREIELKGVVDDLAARRQLVERAGAELVFAGRLEDRRYDLPQRTLATRDHVLRLRIYRAPDESRAELGWKGPTTYEGGFKVREELSAGIAEPDGLVRILARLGYVVIRAIDREIQEYRLGKAMIRFERYPRMDVLVEVEGPHPEIERAIRATGLPRDGFSSERLPAFVARFEARTGERAALCDGELDGTVRYSVDDA